MDKATSGDKNRPIVVFERNTRYGWYGYHVALRLIGLGYTNVRWFRGGLDAWHDAGFAEYCPHDFNRGHASDDVGNGRTS